ncbi:MAG: HAMP domain-containing sensor histidine kinase [Christensenella sp.]
MKQFRSIQLKFILVFIGILFVACIAAMFVASGFVRNSILQDMHGQITTTAKNIVTLSATPMELDDIIETVSNPFYSISIYEPYKTHLPADIDPQTLDGLKENTLYFSKQREAGFPVAVIKVRDSFVIMTSHAENNELVSFRSSAVTVLLFCAMIGAMLMLIAVTQITKPVKRLTRATKEVAKGNFDVSVDCDSSDEIGQLTHHFNLMTRELKNMEYLRKDFVSSVSHEFKTPIASIQGFARLLKTKDLSREEFDEYTDVIISESNRLSKLSSNLLRLSRLENQAIPEASTQFSLDEQIRRT